MFKIGVDISEVLSEGGTFQYTFLHSETLTSVEAIIPKFKEFIVLLEKFVNGNGKGGEVSGDE